MRSALWLALVAAVVVPVRADPTAALSASDLRRSVDHALPILQRSAARFVAERTCISCHHNILPVLMLHMASRRGVAIDTAVLHAVEERTFRGLRGANALDDAVQAVTLNDPTPNDSFLLMAAHAAGVGRGLVPAVYARRLLRWERDGHWVTSDFRPPHSSSVFTATATAIRAVGLYLPEELTKQREAGFQRARQWLLRTHPESTEDASFRLLGLVWAGATAAEVARAARDLLGGQLPGGGWPQLPHYAADAYSTGEALFALHEAGFAITDGAWRRGANFLIATQAADGSWRVHTRMVSPAEVSPEYFATGFPYGKDEYLSYAGSCWAVMALLSAFPETAPEPAIPAGDSAGAPAWTRVALFGTAQELSTLLDTGLDANAHTANGTTVLMMAAPDAEKVRLVLKRGAHPTTRGHSGTDALTIAAAYRGSTEAVRLLLDAGAELQAPSDVHARNWPLLFAAMTGDLDSVKVLLARGADPSAVVAPAVTFGYPDVVRSLIAAGASVRGTESTGINLLHWAVIANRPSIIPILVKAGVPLNATDQNGYTPLMYAATIDFGDTRSLRVLLQAGADPRIRNGAGRTAREQARYYGHTELEGALR